jgi:acyl-lipid omega-6 desaturase (Delta-12 desaturase)
MSTTVSTTMSVKDIRDVLPSDARTRSLQTGVLYFAVSVVVYVALFMTIPLTPTWWGRALAAIACGLSVGILFIVGHDACHGSLTPSSRLNRILGHIAFLPSLHPYAAWEYSHNALHHGFTNLRGKDPVYCPLTVDEYRALPRWRQRLERMYRSLPGVLPLYLVEIWWKLEIAPTPEHRAHIDKRGTYSFDRAIVLAFPFLQATVVALVLYARGTSAGDAAGIIALAITVPFLTFTWLIGFATFQHHTHPNVVWYADADEWGFYQSQVQGTVHVVFPRWIEVLLHNIMEHTAHHVDTKVPLYNLTGAQRQLEATFGAEVITEPFSFAGLRRTFASCCLYDFSTHRWLDFDGRPTTEPRPIGDTRSVSDAKHKTQKAGCTRPFSCEGVSPSTVAGATARGSRGSA